MVAMEKCVQLFFFFLEIFYERNRKMWQEIGGKYPVTLVLLGK